MAETQIELDIEVVQDKIDKVFETYPVPITSNLGTIVEELDSSEDQNSLTQFTRYLSQVEGRIRCKEIRDSSRAEAFGLLDAHRNAQLEAYKHMDATFKSYGGALE